MDCPQESPKQRPRPNANIQQGIPYKKVKKNAKRLLKQNPFDDLKLDAEDPQNKLIEKS